MRPHLVLVQNLTTIVRSLPHAHEGAKMTQADVYKKLPALYSSWHALKLEPKLKGQTGALRNTQESKTLTDLADELLVGNLLPGLMIVLGRLKAITEVAETGGDWNTARHHELVRANELGMLTRADRHNASRDQRDLARLQPSGGRGRGLPARGADG